MLRAREGNGTSISVRTEFAGPDRGCNVGQPFRAVVVGWGRLRSALHHGDSVFRSAQAERPCLAQRRNLHALASRKTSVPFGDDAQDRLVDVGQPFRAADRPAARRPAAGGVLH